MSDANTNKKINSWGSKDSNSKNKAELLKAIADHKQIIASYESTRPTLSSYSNCTYYNNLYVPANRSVNLPSGEYHKKNINLNFNLVVEQVIKKSAISGGYIPNIDKYKNPVLESINKIDRIEIHQAPAIEKSDTNVKLKFNFKWFATIILKTSDSGRYPVQIAGYITGYEMSFFSPADEDTKFRQSMDNIASLKNQMLSDTLSNKELSDIQLTSVDSCDKFISELNTPVQKPTTTSLKDTLNTAIDAITFQGTSKIIDNVIGEINKPATLERKLTKVEVIKKPYSSIQKSLSADDLKKASNKVDERFDKRIHNVNKGSNGDPYSLLTKLDRPGCIKMYPATKDGYANPERIDCFLIQAVQTSLREKFSIFQSLSGDVLAYFFGKQPVIYRFSAALYNTYNQQWWHDFRNHYDKRLRGTAAIKKNIRTVVSYEDHVIEGFFLEMNSNQSTTNPALVNIDFSILLLQETVLGEYSEPADITGYRQGIDDTNMLSFKAMNTSKQTDAENNQTNTQKILSMVPEGISYAIDAISEQASNFFGKALLPSGDLESYIDNVDMNIDIDSTTIPLNKDGSINMEIMSNLRNEHPKKDVESEITNKNEMDYRTQEYKKDEDIVGNANKAIEKNNKTTSYYGEILENGYLKINNPSSVILKSQPNPSADSFGAGTYNKTDSFTYSKKCGNYYYIPNDPAGNGKGAWVNASDVTITSKSSDTGALTSGRLQLRADGNNKIMVQGYYTFNKEYNIGCASTAPTRYKFTKKHGQWFYVENVELIDKPPQSGWIHFNNVKDISYDR